MHLLDTTIIIDYLRGEQKALAYLKRSLSPTISIISQGEIYQGVKNKEELTKLEQILIKFTVLPVTPEISRLGIQLLRRYHLSHGLLILDAFIAATAKIHSLFLVTKNYKHFQAIKEIQMAVW